MARILLIKSSNLTEYNYAVTHPLGIMSIASFLREKGGHEVKILDLRVRECNIPALTIDFRPDIVGISALTMEAPSLHAIAGDVKNVNSDVTVIAGGPHPTSFTQRVLEDNNIDITVLGEGEETMLELCQILKNDGDISTVQGIAYKKDNTIEVTSSRPPIMDLDSLPNPAWDLIDLKDYLYFSKMSKLPPRLPYMTLFTSRACPYRCIYCHNIFGKKFRAMSPKRVMKQIETLINNYAINHFEIVDDIFNLNRKRAEAIMDLILENGHDITLAFPNGLRSDLLDENMLIKMRKAGTKFISHAVETASPRLQKLIRKNLNIEKVKQAISCGKRLGIFSNGFFMLGFPTETREELMKTVKFACESDLHTADFFIVTPSENTELYTHYSHLIEKSQQNFSDYNYINTTSYNMSDVEDKELYRIQKYAYRKFYIDPLRLARLAWVYPPYKWRPMMYLTFIRLAFMRNVYKKDGKNTSY